MIEIPEVVPAQPRYVANIHQRIIGIMSEIDYVAKGDKTVNGQYRFVSHDAVTAKIHPLLVKYGVTVIPTVEEMTQEANRTVVKLLISIVNADCPSDNFTLRYVGYGIDGSDKGPGKAISYAYKYALLKLFCLETGDDPDNDAKSIYEPVKCIEFDTAVPGDYTEKQWAHLDKFLQYSASVTGKHKEDIKREALKRMPEFLSAASKWSKKDTKTQAKEPLTEE